ncbi:MAG: alanine racemase [Oscillospiraceae bacterium]|nr:alanine racemase [Oscillospiraceae bacterium]
MKDFFQRAWLEIHLDALARNFGVLNANPKAKVLAVVKADAYGHGVAQVVTELAVRGCDWFGVSNLEEALQVRAAARKAEILILGYTPPRYAKVLAEHNITQTVLDSGNARALFQAAQECGVSVKVHVKVDTGMSRLGFFFQDEIRDRAVIDDILAVCSLPALEIEGIFTHFACADDPVNGREFTERQYALFLHCLESLQTRGVSFKYRHCCNSAAALLYPHMHMDMIRPGLALFGISIDKNTALEPAMEMKTVLSQIKELPVNTPVSYGSTARVARKTLSGTVPVGYADGYPRALSNRGYMLLRGKRVPILGRVCMDQSVLDISGLDHAATGDTVTVFGHDGGDEISIQTLSEMVAALPYELLCSINKRVPRVYLRRGEIIDVANYMLFDVHGVRLYQ